MALQQQIEDYIKALNKLQQSYNLASKHEQSELFEYFRDSTIQRFEFTLEIFWKSIKSYLLEHEGIECRSPKGCIREFFRCGYIDEETTKKFLKMVDDRNLTAHTYQEEIANEIFDAIKEYITLLQNVLSIIRH